MKKRQPPWFKCRPSSLLGELAGMQPDEGYLYVIVTMRIYEVGGPIADNVKVLARRTGLSERRVAAALSALVEMDKICVAEDGAIDIVETHEILDDREKVLLNAKNGGNASAESRRNKTQQNQQNALTGVENKAIVVERKVNHRDLDIDIDLSKKDSEAIASAQTPPPIATQQYPIDPTERLWVEGLEHLLAMGATDRAARSNIGRWLRMCRGDPGRVLDAIRRARDHGTRDPIPLVSRLLSPINPRPSLGNSVHAALDTVRDRVAAGLGERPAALLLPDDRR
jgi:uncharacterized protein YdaU (DUF1376 family)